MSGQRNKKPDDIIMKRQEYLDNLNQEIALQDANEQAVKQYKATGQLPPVTQMKDNRTVEDKLRDFEKLKASIREDLAPIASSQLANSIIQKIQNSPFNQDNGLLIFFAQRALDLVKNLQKSYKFGIKGDENDAVQFVNFIEKFYSDKNNLTSNAKQFMTRLGSNNQTSLAKKASQQSEILNRLDAEINRIILDLERTLPNNAMFAVFKQYLAAKRGEFVILIDNIRTLYPTDLIYDKPQGALPVTLTNIEEGFNTLMLNRAFTPQQTALSDDYKLFINYINHNIPNTDYINVLLSILQRVANTLKLNQNTINVDKVYEALDNLYGQINMGESIQEIIRVVQALNRILVDVRANMPNVQAAQPAAAAAAQPAAAAAAQPAAAAAAQPAAAAAQAQPAGAPAGGPAQGVVNPPLYTIQDFNNRADFLEKIIRDRQMDRDVIRQIDYAIQYLENQIAINRITVDQGYYELENLGKRVHLDLQRMGRGFNDFKIQGTGFSQAYGFTKQYVEPSQGVQTDPRYIKFGRYLVNTKSLKDNKLSLRREKGTPIASLPVYKMSNPFSKVIKKIVGGALPSQEDFSDLTEEELRYLHKVSKESDLSHKIEIPTPSKDEDEKDAHLFNVYKGEIMAGNDNKEMIRKFKLLLMKLSKNNTINKKEANEILEMLTHAGY